MKSKFFILTGEERLAEAIKANYDPALFETTVVKDWSSGSDLLYGGQYDVLFLDLESLRGESIDTFISIDTMCARESVKAVLVVRTLSDSIRSLQEKMTGMETVIETKKGRSEFNQAVRAVVSDVMRFLSDVSIAADVSIEMIAQEEVDLALPNSGNVNDYPVFDLLFAINIRNATGYLTFAQGSKKAKFAFRRGDFLLSEDTQGTGDLRDCLAWTSGTFSFARKDAVSGRRKRLSKLLAEVARNDVPRRLAMDAMMASMSKYPVPTSIAESAKIAYSAFPEALEMLERVDGKTRWNQLIGEGEHAFHAAFFLIHTYLVFTYDTPFRKVNLLWSREVREARDREHLADVAESKAYRAVASQDEMERELRNLMRDFKAGNAYTVFALWEGCGASAVQNRFYELVKEHHPDVYGGNTSGQVKSLAQDIFILVKDAFMELRQVETGEQTVAVPFGFERPETAKATTTLEEPSDIDSGTDSEGRTRRESVASEPGISEELEVEVDEKRRRLSTVPPTRAKVDVKAKMEQLSAVRKKRSRRTSIVGNKGKKKTTPSRTLTPDPSTLELLADVASEPRLVLSEAEDEELKANKARLKKLEALRKRAKDKNPGSVSTAQENFREGFKLYREEEFEDAYKKFKKAYEQEPDRASHVAFYAYLWFRTDPENAREAEELLRKAIEMNDRQTQPDALLFLAHMVKARGEPDTALKFYEKAFALNPNSREAERELRLAKMRGGSRASEPGTFIKNLFKK